MSTVSQYLKAKYNLFREPTEREVQDWSNKTIEYQNKGLSLAPAAHRAAQEAFLGFMKESKSAFDSRPTAQADDVKTILNMIKGGK